MAKRTDKNDILKALEEIEVDYKDVAEMGLKQDTVGIFLKYEGDVEEMFLTTEEEGIAVTTRALDAIEKGATETLTVKDEEGKLVGGFIVDERLLTIRIVKDLLTAVKNLYS